MTDKEINEIRFLAEKWLLDGRELLADPEDVRRDCNGIGAEWMGKYLRGAVSALNPTLGPAAAIHDRRYAIGGDGWARAAADMEFLENGLKSADARYGWYDLRRYRVREQARKFYTVLRVAGGAAWRKEKEA
ncbi:MAG: hypothetical protein IJS01_10205 [Lentisphaeria bacterium]|nr:hypothetical protein [Lentisphaeria bacterium]